MYCLYGFCESNKYSNSDSIKFTKMNKNHKLLNIYYNIQRGF